MYNVKWKSTILRILKKLIKFASIKHVAYKEKLRKL